MRRDPSAALATLVLLRMTLFAEKLPERIERTGVVLYNIEELLKYGGRTTHDEPGITGYLFRGLFL